MSALTEKQKEKREKRKRNRKQTIEELVQTEKTYVDNLRLLDINYLTPLKKLNILSDNQHSTLFSQIKIILNFNSNFCTNLAYAVKNNESIGQEMLTFCPFFKLYREYVNNYEKANILLKKLHERPEFVAFDEEARKRCRNYSVQDLLITPIQRVPRYPLLLIEILKNTEESHPDHPKLEDALVKFKIVNQAINEGIKERERRDKVREISDKVFDGGKAVSLVGPARRFLMQGELNKVCRKKNQKYTFFLFNDLILYCEPQGKYFKLHNQIDIDESFSLLDMSDEDGYPAHSFALNSVKKSFVIFGDSKTDRDKWYDAIANAKKDFDNGVKRRETDLERGSSLRVAPVMVPDHFKKKCQVCQSKFTLLRRRHHCRRCGIVVCGQCSQGRLADTKDPTKNVRVCANCFKDNVNAREVVRPAGYSVTSSTRRSTATTSQKSLRVDSGEMKADSIEATPEPSYSPQLFQITFFLGPMATRQERSDMLSKHKGDGRFYLCEGGDDSLLLISRQKNKMVETPLTMRINDKGSVTFHTTKPVKGSFQTVEALIAKLRPSLGLKKAIPRNPDQTMTVEDTANYDRGVVLYDYTAKAEGDLTLKKGDEVVILDQSDGIQGWWTGMVGDRQGLFPSTYIEVISNPRDKEDKSSRSGSSEVSAKPSKKGKSKKKSVKKGRSKGEPPRAKKGDVLVATYKHEKGTNEELSFEVDDEIILHKKDNSGWWLGKLKRTQKLGWFPPALVELKSKEVS